MQLVGSSCCEAPTMDTNICEFSCPCFHKIDRLLDITIVKCEYKKKDSGWWHALFFRDMMKIDLKPFVDYEVVRNDRCEIIRFEERLEDLPLMTFYNVPIDSSNKIIQGCASYITHFLLKLTASNMLNPLVARKNISTFLQTLVFLYNEQMGYTHKYINEKSTNKKLLVKQASDIFDVLKSFLFVKRKEKSKKKKLSTCENCKLNNYTERFINYNYEKFHQLYCNTDDIQTKLTRLEDFMDYEDKFLPQMLEILKTTG